MFVCHDKGKVFLYNKFTSICILVTTTISQTTISQTKNVSKIRYFTEKSISKYAKILNTKTWEYLEMHNNAQDSFNFFYNFFLSNFENVFPEKYIEIKYKNRHSWMPKSLLKSIRNNHSLYKLSITNPAEINKLTYKTYNKWNSIKRKAERDYFSNQLEINKYYIKKSWRIMKSVIGNKRKMHQKNRRFVINDKIIDNDLHIANAFNNCFVSVGPILAAKLTTTSLNPIDFLQHHYSSMVISQIHDLEVVNIIRSLNNSSPGWDDIPSFITKRVLNSYIKPLTVLINRSFQEGIVPDEINLAKVIPIYKSGSTMELNNYRPISVLNIFSKIFERLMYNRLIFFLDKYNILY